MKSAMPENLGLPMSLGSSSFDYIFIFLSNVVASLSVFFYVRAKKATAIERWLLLGLDK